MQRGFVETSASCTHHVSVWCDVHSYLYCSLVHQDRPSKRLRALIQQGAKMILDVPADLFDELDKATLNPEYMQAVAEDPVLVEAIRRSLRSNQLHWAAANVSHPGEPVPANVGPELLTIARNLVRRGIDDSTAVDAYRIAQNVGWRFWAKIVFALTSDLDELRELLEISHRSLTSFIDVSIAAIYRQLQIERDELILGTHAEKRGAVELILSGVPISLQDAEGRLGYRLEQGHTAAVIWGNESTTKLSELDCAAKALTQDLDGRRSLFVPVRAVTLWVWLPGNAGPDLTAVTAAVSGAPGVCVAVGSTASGIEGFRRSHLDALTTQRIMLRPGFPRRVARFADVELVALITANPERVDRFIKDTLGDFESADPDLQRAVLTYVHDQCNSTRAAATLFTHRNTLLRMLTRADELLPRPLERTSVNVAVALEALRWRGTGN